MAGYAPTVEQPMLVAGGIGGTPRIWMYRTADAATVVRVTGYFTDGYSLGMRDGDLIYCYVSGTKVWNAYTVTVSGTTVDLSDATAVTITTNTD